MIIISLLIKLSSAYDLLLKLNKKAGNQDHQQPKQIHNRVKFRENEITSRFIEFEGDREI